MLIALYRANIDQFDGKNMNRIRAGKILRMPDQGELMGVGQPDAAKEIRAQTADWNAYRQKLAAAAPVSSKPQDAKQVATGKIASSVADKTPVVKESAKEVLKLSKGELPGDKAATGAAGKTPTAQDKKNAEQEDAIAKAKSLKEEQTRTAMLEKNLKDMQRLAQLKEEAAALQKPSSAVTSVAASSPVVATSETAAASAVKPVPVAKPKPTVVVAEPSLVDQILGEPLYQAGGAAVLLGLGGIGFMLSRRKQGFTAATAEKKSESTSAVAGRVATSVAPSPESGDFTSTAAAKKAEESPKSDNVDPISEADLFLNFGRDVQAEEILKDALRNTPGDHRIHLKLLGIYANRKDINSFSPIARQLKDSGDEEAWQEAAAMGRRLEPNNPMYGGSSIEDAESATTQTTVLNASEEYVQPRLRSG
jgi:pilus assembly protein FimV